MERRSEVMILLISPQGHRVRHERVHSRSGMKMQARRRWGSLSNVRIPRLASKGRTLTRGTNAPKMNFRESHRESGLVIIEQCANCPHVEDPVSTVTMRTKEAPGK